MSNQPTRSRRFLFVDDDNGFLLDLKQLFTEMSRGGWEIFTAEKHSQALAVLREQSIDVVVLDIDMPVMDGLQLLRLLIRTYPGQQVVILTGHGSEERRKMCLEAGAALFLEKLITPEGFATVYESLDLLATAGTQEGFRGMMRRVGLQEVLQMECLGKKSSLMEISTGKVAGRIYVSDGDIVHAQSGSLQGEMALYGLLGLRGGQFNLLPFSEPSQRTISGNYEFLLMEAARLNDEGCNPLENPAPQPISLDNSVAPERAQSPGAHTEVAPVATTRIEEILLASGSGSILYDWKCTGAAKRMNLLQQVEADGNALSRALPAGRFDRVEIRSAKDRIVCQTQPDMRLFVRSARLKAPEI